MTTGARKINPAAFVIAVNATAMLLGTADPKFCDVFLKEYLALEAELNPPAESGLVKELVEALTRAKETIEMLHQHGNFDNGVYDATNTICEGVVLTDRYVNAAMDEIDTALAKASHTGHAVEATEKHMDELSSFLSENKPNMIVQDANQSWWKPSVIVQFKNLPDATKFCHLLTKAMD